jgi:hypothetical protein
VVLTRDPKGRLQGRAYFSTDTERSAEDILRVFSFRWEIEVAFRNTKQTLGLQDAQNGWWRRRAHAPKPRQRAGPNPKGQCGMNAISHTLPIGFLAYALVLLWYFQSGNSALDVARARREAPWYTQKTEPSFADMLVAIRRQIWKQRLSTNPSRGRLPEKIGLSGTSCGPMMRHLATPPPELISPPGLTLCEGRVERSAQAASRVEEEEVRRAMAVAPR